MKDAVFSKEIEIDGRKVGPGHPCFIIAEVGVNHNGDPATAIKMIEAAAEAGVDCVKFQTFSAEEFVNDPDDTYEYISQGETVKESMLAMFQRLELKREEFAKLFKRTRELGMIAFSTPTDRAAVDLLVELGTPAFKVGSDDLVYTPFLEYVAGKGLPMIISSGMAQLEDVERAVTAIGAAGLDQLILLHCVSLYPTPEDEIHLRKISALQAMYDLPIGFSDHSFGVTAALGAVALGACVIEKHFTLDRNMPGPDHRFSADPEELTRLVKEVRTLEKALGSPRLKLSAAEQEMADLCHRSIAAATDLPPGHVIAESDLIYQRPGTGLMPYETQRIVGRKTTRAIPAGTLLGLDMLDGV